MTHWSVFETGTPVVSHGDDILGIPSRYYGMLWPTNNNERRDNSDHHYPGWYTVTFKYYVACQMPV